jgi:hypothetical protein
MSLLFFSKPYAQPLFHGFQEEDALSCKAYWERAEEVDKTLTMDIAEEHLINSHIKYEKIGQVIRVVLEETESSKVINYMTFEESSTLLSEMGTVFLLKYDFSYDMMQRLLIDQDNFLTSICMEQISILRSPDTPLLEAVYSRGNHIMTVKMTSNKITINDKILRDINL